MKYAFLTIFLIFNFFAGEIFSKTATEVTWKSLLKDHANCVTWISATVRLEVSVGRSMPLRAKTRSIGHHYRRRWLNGCISYKS